MDEGDIEIKENPDIAYIKRDDIGVVIAKGLSRLYREQPKNPVDYLGKWLLNFSHVKSEANNILESKQKVQELKDRKDLEEQNQMREKEEELKKEKEKLNKVDDFRNKVDEADDLADLLQRFSHYLQEFTGATGVYIGQLIRPNKPITDDDDDKAHENPEAPEIIKYIHATPDHEFLIEQTLTQEQGCTHDVFKPPEPKEGEGDEEKKEEPNEGEGEAEPKEPEKPKPQSLLVGEVVRDQRIHYFKVPRLGSYLAVELKYKSCLNEESFEKAFDDFLKCQQDREDQEADKKEYNEQQQEDKDRLGDDYKEPDPPKEWPEIKEHPFD